ncbi:hypothetical protein Pint_11863 [Pistacia integerrima]|uniref:Uncharacterized protein n=1 Tax=Pistacia integerrima TaxID=434235 RepID=A0ACC0XK17_9ROSI|nr:hypothetical protein Pint_11863 [Pistacia integerrima]
MVEITQIADEIGVGVHFNPFVTWNDKMLKYGVVRMDDLVHNILNWDRFYLSVRLQKLEILCLADFLNSSSPELYTYLWIIWMLQIQTLLIEGCIVCCSSSLALQVHTALPIWEIYGCILLRTKTRYGPIPFGDYTSPRLVDPGWGW